jgi:SM-20-related protein
VFAINLQRFHATPLIREPFEYVIVPGFVRESARWPLEADFPCIREPGSFPLRALHAGPAFRRLVSELTGPEMCAAFSRKFALDLAELPTVVTVRGRCGPKDGTIHTDLPGKVITVLLYLNATWFDAGGQLRLLRSPSSLDEVVAEVPPVEGTLLAFRRSDNSWHGHRPFIGERRVVQMNWVTPRHRRALRRAAVREAMSSLVRNVFSLARAG